MKQLFLTIFMLFLSVIGLKTLAQCPTDVYNIYKFDEGAGTTASGMLGGQSIVLNNPVWEPGVMNSCVTFNGVNSKATLTDSKFNWQANEDFTIEFWFNIKSFNASQPMVLIGRDDPSTPLHWWIGIDNATQKPSFYLRDNDSYIAGITSNTAILANTWYHLAVVRNNQTNENLLYINGQLKASIQLDYTGNFNSTAPVNFGYLNYNQTDSYFSNCSLDEIVIHNSALDVNTILNHYSNQLNNIPICTVPDVINNPGEPVKILTLGNSITYDDHSNDYRTSGQRGGYRVHLYNLLKNAGYNFDFIGSEVAGQDLFPDPENGGFPGINKDQMVTLLQTGYNPRTSTQVTPGPYLDYYLPDVILLHIGTNDFTTDVTAIQNILNIIDSYRTSSGKDIKLLIARIINRNVYHAGTTQYNDNLEQVVINHGNSSNYIVDMENGAGINYSTEMVDYLHPNDVGYSKMAALWFNTLTGILPPPTSCPATLTNYWDFNETQQNTFVDQISGVEAISNGSTSSVSGKIGNAVSFNGSTSEVSISNGSSFNWNTTTNFSIQFWIKLNSLPASPANYVIIGRDDPSTQLHWWIGINSNGSQAHIESMLTANNGENQSLNSTKNIIDNTWHLISLVRNGQAGTTSLFIDNNLEVSGTMTFSDNFNSTVPVNVGWLNIAPYYHYIGNLDELALYNKSLSNNEIQSIYLAGLDNFTYCQYNFIKSPSNLTTVPSSAKITLSWNDNSSNESGFIIERKSGSDPFTQVAQVNTNVNSYVDNNLFPLTSYTYRVYAINENGSSKFSNESTAQTPQAPGVSNLAPGKPVIQSSTAYGGVPERAIDNNTDGSWSGNSVTHTGNDLNAYWQIDLQSVNNISNIEIWNRTDYCCIGRLVNFYVMVSDVPFTSTNLNTTLNQSGVWNTLIANYPNPSTIVNVNRTGRYVRIQFANQGEINLAEVKIFGSSGPPPTPTSPADPSSLNSIPVSSSGIQLNWVDNSNNEDGFRVERKTGANSFAQIAQLSANTTSYSDIGLTASTSYTYRIYAYNSIGSSGYSNESSAQTLSNTAVTNLAPGKPVTQSSTSYGGVPERAIDNNTDGSWSGNSVTHTGNDVNAYWQIDLQAVNNISNIEIWNRTDNCCIGRLVNFYVLVSDVPFTSTNLNTTLIQSGVWNTLIANYPNPSSIVNVNRTGRYVRIQFAGQNEMNLAEVKIFGSSGPPPTPTAPAAPASLNTQAVSSSSIQLNWVDNSANEDGFRVERKTGANSYAQIAQLSANSTSYSDIGLTASTGYTYRVYAYNSIGNSGYSNESSAQTLSNTSVTNLAPGKPVTQSSTSYGGVPERAIDNNTDGSWSGNSVTHTGNDVNAYWQIDLQSVYNINNIEIWNRTDNCCIGRLVNFYVLVSDVPFTSTNLNTTLNQSGVWNTLIANYPNPSTIVNVNRTGRYVRIQFAGQNEMNLAEVKIFSSIGLIIPITKMDSG